MKVTTVVLNAAGDPHFETVDDLDVEQILCFAREREALTRANGAEWTMGCVTFYGGELVAAVQTGEHHDLDAAVANMVMATCLFVSIYCGVSSEEYRSSDLKFVLSENGTVAITRVPACAV